MPRPLIAAFAGISGFLLYVGAVVALADPVLQLHWLVQLAYFLVAGIAYSLWRTRGTVTADAHGHDAHGHDVHGHGTHGHGAQAVQHRV